jgi:hypothetical protein
MRRADFVAEQHGHEDLVCLDGPEFDDCIIGLAYRAGADPAFAYDVMKVIEVLMGQGMDRDSAEEWFEVNIVSAYMGDGSPVFVELNIDEA